MPAERTKLNKERSNAKAKVKAKGKGKGLILDEEIEVVAGKLYSTPKKRQILLLVKKLEEFKQVNELTITHVEDARICYLLAIKDSNMPLPDLKDYAKNCICAYAHAERAGKGSGDTDVWKDEAEEVLGTPEAQEEMTEEDQESAMDCQTRNGAYGYEDDEEE